MDLLGVRKLIADALQKIDDLEQVVPLGNVVYLHVGGVEYEVVIRTVKPDGWWTRETSGED